MSDGAMTVSAIIAFGGGGLVATYAIGSAIHCSLGKILDALAGRPRHDLVADDRWRAMHSAADRRGGFAPADPRATPRRRRAS